MSHILETIKEKAHEVATNIKESELGTSVAKLTGTYDPLTMSTPTSDEKAMSGHGSGSNSGGGGGGALPSMAVQSLTPHGHNVATSVGGCPFADITHSLNIGGHVLASDTMLMEKQQTFNRSKIVERMVHPCGAGAIGHFEVTRDVKDLTCASFLSNVGKKTPVFGRFSTTTFGREFPDQGRNPRGFALKFYTDDGNYDMVGLHFPIFFVRDPSLGPDLIRSQQRNPSNFLLDLDALFDFLAGVPESLHCGTMMFSDYGTPVGFRQMNAFGCHTFKWVTHDGKETFVKYHFVSENGIANFSWPEAIRICGEDPDFAKRDLYSHIEKGGTASWRFHVQTMTHDQIDSLDFDPFDVTKVWPHSQFPLREVGRLVFDKNPESYHRDVEQVAFSPGSLVRGIELSPDALLQWRSFFYRDTQYYRLGVNLHQIPINCPIRASNVHPITRDGRLRSDSNSIGDPQYAMNYRSAPAIGDSAYHTRAVPMQGYITRGRAYKGKAAVTQSSPDMASSADMDPEEEYRQVRQLYGRVMNEKQRDHLHFNIGDQLKLCRVEVRKRFLAAIYKIAPEYAAGVVAAMDRGTNGGIRMDMQEIARDAASMPCHRPFDGCPVAPMKDRSGMATTTTHVTGVGDTRTSSSAVHGGEHRAGYGDYGGHVLGAMGAITASSGKPTAPSSQAQAIEGQTPLPASTPSDSDSVGGVTQPLLSLPRHTYASVVDKSTRARAPSDSGTGITGGATPSTTTTTTTTPASTATLPSTAGSESVSGKPSEKAILADSRSASSEDSGSDGSGGTGIISGSGVGSGVSDQSKDKGKEKPSSISSSITTAVSTAASGVIAAGERLLGREPSTTSATTSTATSTVMGAGQQAQQERRSPEQKYTGASAADDTRTHTNVGGIGGGQLLAYPQLHPSSYQQQQPQHGYGYGHVHYPRELRGDDRIKSGHISYDPYGRDDERQEAIEPKGHYAPIAMGMGMATAAPQKPSQPFVQQPQQTQSQAQQQQQRLPSQQHQGQGAMVADKSVGQGQQQQQQPQAQTQQQHQRHAPLYEPSSRGYATGGYQQQPQPQYQGQGQGQQQPQQPQQQYGGQRSYDSSPPRKELGTGAYGKQPLQQSHVPAGQTSSYQQQPSSSQYGPLGGSQQQQQGQNQKGRYEGQQQSSVSMRQLPSFEAPSSSSSSLPSIYESYEGQQQRGGQSGTGYTRDSYDSGNGHRSIQSQQQQQQQRRYDAAPSSGGDRDEYQYGYQTKPLSPYTEPHEYRVRGGGSYTIGGVPSLPSFTPTATAASSYDDRGRVYDRSHSHAYGGYDGVSLPSSRPSSYVSSIGSLLGLRGSAPRDSQASMYRGPYYNDGHGMSNAGKHIDDDAHAHTRAMDESYPLSTSRFVHEIEHASNILQRHYGSDEHRSHATYDSSDRGSSSYGSHGHGSSGGYGYGSGGGNGSSGHGTGGGNYASYRGYQQQPHHLRYY